MTYTPKSLEWFKARLNKRVYRDSTGCECSNCAYVVKNGLVVGDEEHARHLADIDADFAAEGVFCNYRDEK